MTVFRFVSQVADVDNRGAVNFMQTIARITGAYKSLGSSRSLDAGGSCISSS